MNVANLARFLARLRQAYPTQILYLAWENWPVHRHARVLAALGRLDSTVLWLPADAPWTNPVETRWRWVKHTLVHPHRLAKAPHQGQQHLATVLNPCHAGAADLFRSAGRLPN